MTLCVRPITVNTGISKNSLSSLLARFSSGELNLRVVKYKANYFGLKFTEKVLKFTKFMTPSYLMFIMSKFRLMKKVTKSQFSSPIS